MNFDLQAGLSRRCGNAFTSIVCAMVVGVAIAAPFLIGCGPASERPALVPVTGTVLLDETPLEDAIVTFTPKTAGAPASGRTDADGRFVLSTYGDNDGAAVGEYDVAVAKVKTVNVHVDSETRKETREEVSPAGRPAPSRYADRQSSGLTAVVKDEGTNDITLKLLSSGR